MKILVGATSSPQGLAAIDRALLEAELQPSELVFYHYERASPALPDETMRTSAHERLERNRSRAERAGIPARIVEQVGASTFASQLLKVADQERVDLIILGIRRRSLVGKLVLGSDEQQILLQADCPVLVVKAPTVASA